MSDLTALRTERLKRSFHVGHTEVHAVDGIDLVVPRATLTVLKGRSGSGKTTLLNLIGGLDRPTEGEVFIDDRPLSSLSEIEMTTLRRERIGFVFQSFALLPTFSARENVELPLRIARVDPDLRRERVRLCLELVGLEGRDEHRPWELSGGQQQRVAIARALAANPSILLADEPTGELDTASGEEIMKLFRRIVDENRVTVIMASHDPTVDDFATVICELRDGKIVARRSGSAVSEC